MCSPDGLKLNCSRISQSYEFKLGLIGTERHTACQEHIPDSSTEAGLHVYTKPWPLTHLKVANQDLFHKAIFFQSAVVKVWCACVNFTFSFMFSADRGVAFDLVSCCSPSASRLHTCFIFRNYSKKVEKQLTMTWTMTFTSIQKLYF